MHQAGSSFRWPPSALGRLFTSVHQAKLLAAAMSAKPSLHLGSLPQIRQVCVFQLSCMPPSPDGGISDLARQKVACRSKSGGAGSIYNAFPSSDFLWPDGRFIYPHLIGSTLDKQADLGPFGTFAPPRSFGHAAGTICCSSPQGTGFSGTCFIRGHVAHPSQQASRLGATAGVYKNDSICLDQL